LPTHTKVFLFRRPLPLSLYLLLLFAFPSPHSWRDFATSLKHKRKEFPCDDLITTLDVEEKARAKDTRGKAIAGNSSANIVQRGNPKSQKN
jgi:hypothetical protein